MFDLTMTIQTPIGNGEKTSGWRAIASGLTAAAVVSADVYLVSTDRTSLIGLRTFSPVLAFMFYALLYRVNPAAIGIRVRPIQGLRYWVVATAVIGAVADFYISG